MLRETAPNQRQIDTSYGFRYSAGDSVDMGIIISKDGSTGSQNHFGAAFTLQGATSTVLGVSAVVAGVIASMF